MTPRKTIARTLTEDEVAELIARGYRRTSRKYGWIFRVDREDWAEQVAPLCHFDAEHIRARPEQWADFYRARLSRDGIELRADQALRIPTSGNDPVTTGADVDPKL